MKQVFALFVAVAFSTAMFAQTQTDKKTETKQSAPKTEAKAAHSDYVMMNGKMSHCMGEKQEPMTKDVTLKNGTMVSTKGEVTTKDGKKSTLQNGQCIDASGKTGSFKDMHPGAKMDDKMKM